MFLDQAVLVGLSKVKAYHYPFLFYRRHILVPGPNYRYFTGNLDVRFWRVQETKKKRTPCKVEYDSICETVKNQHCKSIPVKQCHTEYSTISKTIQHRQCRKVDEQLCHRVPKEQ